MKPPETSLLRMLMILPKPRELTAMWRDTIAQWTRDRASRLAAALAYYALLSLAPLLVVTVLVMLSTTPAPTRRIRR